MDVGKRTLVGFMEGSDKLFVIPVYQRNYNWKEENCKQLYADLVNIIKKNKPSHFFGSIVFANEPSGLYTKSLIIDGQQRLTTVSLLFLAMYDRLKEGSVTSENKQMQTDIFQKYLVIGNQANETRIKLKQIKNDQAEFRKFFVDGSPEHDKGSNLWKNYNCFFQRLGKMNDDGITIDSLYAAISRLEIISIALGYNDTPQSIFESLNSTGLPLQEGDKIRNFLFMGFLNEEVQNKYYQDYWSKIETYTHDEGKKKNKDEDDVSTFVRDYLSLKRGGTTKSTEVYKIFKKYVNKAGENKIPDILEELTAYAVRYNVLLTGDIKAPDDIKKGMILKSCINRLNRLETTVTRPFFLRVLQLHDKKILTLDEVVEIFKTTESYLFRRIICGLGSNGLNKFFAGLHNEITRYDDSTDDYINKFKYALLSKKEISNCFPDDEEFVDAFSKKTVYKSTKNSLYILERLENFAAGKEGKEIYKPYDKQLYSIEHIMPQTLTPEWKKDLGDNYNEIQGTWLDRIANLTLTAYNPDYSNKTFIEKKTGKHGYEQSGFKLNTYIATFNKWDEKSLKERDKYLTEEALKIWPRLTTGYVPPAPASKHKPTDNSKSELEHHTLAEDENLLLRKEIVKFSFKDKNYKVISWRKMYQQAIQLLFAEHSSTILRLAAEQEGLLASQFTMLPPAEKGYRAIGNGVYVFVGHKVRKKLQILKELFKECEETPSDLIFYLRAEESAGESSE